MLMELPSTLPNLKNMTFLDISGNGLAHLAIKPLTTSEVPRPPTHTHPPTRQPPPLPPPPPTPSLRQHWPRYPGTAHLFLPGLDGDRGVGGSDRPFDEEEVLL